MRRDSKQRITIGNKYGRLTVVSSAGKTKDGRQQFFCVCECGKELVVLGKSLKSGNTKSCGCYRHEAGIVANTTHGMSKTHIYRIWASMKDRCFRPKNTNFQRYGGRGITVCQEWLSFENFWDWAKNNGYKEGLSIDRINANGNYEPSNCRWITMCEQASNKRSNVFFTFNGETHTMKQWSEITGINYYTMQNRYKAGKTIDEIFAGAKAVGI